ncbi:MAG: hypothetical protein U5N86_09630 [Planctomycetota bacterium]|nr:hypothetical protein [Planctomycetota bacterium]
MNASMISPTLSYPPRDVESALEALAHLFGIVLETPEVFDGAGVDDNTVTHEPHLVGTVEHTFAHIATRDGSDAADLEGLPNLDTSGDDLVLDGFEKSLQCVLDVVHEVVDDVVIPYLDAEVLGESS